MFSDEEKERVEKEGRQDDEDNEDMVSNDEEQNIEEDVDVTGVECRFKVHDLNYEPAMNRRSEFVTLHLPLPPLSVSPMSLHVSMYMYLSVPVCFSLSAYLSPFFLSSLSHYRGLRTPLDIIYG